MATGTRIRIHLVSNAHLDPAWQWEWEEGAAAALSTFRCAAGLCEQDPTFIFNHNEALLYHWVECYDPRLFERIRALVASGRWHVMGGWHLQPDCNLPAGESLVRQVITGLAYFRERFGRRPTTAVNVDAFGFSRGLVQILVRAGFDACLFARPGRDLLDLPAEEFLWIGYDGSSLFAHRLRDGYHSALGHAADKVLRRIDDDPGRTPLLVLWGVGDHGGGPSRRDLDDLSALAARLRERGIDLVHSTPEAYITEARAARSRDGCPLPAYAGALRHAMTGCYTSLAHVKRRHRELENLLYSVEKMASCAAMAGIAPYPREGLEEASHDLMLTQFHDILPGTSTEPVERASLRLLGHGAEVVARLRASLMFRCAAGLPPVPDDTIPIVAFNPHPYPVQGVFSCEFMLPDQNWSGSATGATLFTADGRALPTQVVREDSSIPLDWRKRVLFEAELAPAGISRFDCHLSPLPTRESVLPVKDLLRVAGGRLSVEFDPRAGGMVNLSVDGRRGLGRDGMSLCVVRDTEDSWGSCQRSYGDIVGLFVPASPREAARICASGERSLPPVRIVERGPVATRIEAVLVHGRSHAVVTYQVPSRGTVVMVTIRVFWAEHDRMLRARFATGAPAGRFLAQDAFGRADLPADGSEHPMLAWCALVGDDGAALGIVNEGLHATSCRDGILEVALLRSPAYCAHPLPGRRPLPPRRYSARMDTGVREARIWVVADAGDRLLAGIDRLAQGLNEAPYLLPVHSDGSGAAATGSPGGWFLVDGDALVMSALKQAEDRDGFIARLFNPRDLPATARVQCPPLGIDGTVTLPAFTLATYRLRRGSFVETDLCERPMPGSVGGP